MPRFFQHLEPGDNLGKITKLKYIDDISDDDMILYYFEDGTFCNSEFIAGVEDEGDPIMDKKVMVELAGPQYTWQFIKKEVIPEVTKVVQNDGDGQFYEAVGPDVHLNKANGGMTRSIEEVRQNSIRTDVKRPKKPAKFRQEPDDPYLLSEHPDLENAKSAPDTSASTGLIPGVIKKKTKMKPVEDYDFDAEPVQEEAPVVQPKKTAQPNKKVLNMDIPKMNVETITVSDGDWSVTISKEEFKKRLMVSSDEIERIKKEVVGKSPFDERISKEDVLIKNMIDKSKKKSATIRLNVSMELPPKEIYNTIRDVYEEGMADEFVKSVTARISMDNLLESLSSGMKKFYEGSDK